MKKIKKLLTPYDTNMTKKRYGSDSDGGYVLIEEVVGSCTRVYSLGIDKEFSIDLQLAEMNKKVFQYDCNFCVVPYHENMEFKQLFITNKTLKEELISTGGTDDDKNILLMDIEGSEYDVVINSDTELLNSFSLISLELHYATKEPKIENLLEKMNETHLLVHIHANNWVLSKEHQNYINGPGIVDGVPDLLELTYVKKTKISNSKVMSEKVPTIYDRKNTPYLEEVQLDWWI